MAANPLALESVTELLDRSRALQRATAVVIADCRAIFSQSQAFRAEVCAQMAHLRREDWCAGAA
jgi:hypothetical protein